MPKQIQVWSDYVCPFCFLAEQPLQAALARSPEPVDVEWMPFELRPEPTPTLQPEGGYLRTTWAQSVYPLAQRMGVRIVLPRVSPQPYTRMALEGYQFAREYGQGNAYTHRMFTAFFQDELDIGDLDILTRLAGEIGLNAEAYRLALAQGTYHGLHQELLREATEQYGITSVPTFLIGDIRLVGVQPPEAILAALDAVGPGATRG